MTAVLTCPRCLQSRSLTDGAPPLSCVCPFCHYEWETSLSPAPHAIGRKGRARSPKRWPALLLAGLVIFAPATLFGALLAHRHSPVERMFESTVLMPTANVDSSSLVRKPEIIFSGQAAHSSPVVMDRRFMPKEKGGEETAMKIAPSPKEKSASPAKVPARLSSRAQCVQCHNTHTLALRPDLGIASPGIFFAARLDAANLCPVLASEDAEHAPAKN